MLDLGTLQAHIKLDGADKFQTDLDGAATKTETLGSKLKSGLASAGKFCGKAFLAVGAAAAAGLGAITTQAIKAYADTEQLRGGVEKLFGKESAKTIEANAQAAFATVGVSANEYMETVTSFSASLLQSLGGDTEAAASSADMAMRDMADNANTFGTSMEDLQRTYQSLARGNYGMLDNLKLGYGGTQKEMERLLADAGKLTGKKYDISNLNDVYEAIHAIQEEQNIAGTTAAEASKTISGSLNATKAAWTNLLAGLADPKADLGALIDNLLQSAGNVVSNILPVIERVVTSVGEMLPMMAEKISALLPELLPAVQSVFNGIAQALPQLMNGIVTALVQLIPVIIDAGIALFTGLVDALPEVIDTLVNSLPDIITAIVDAIPKLIPALMQAGVVLFSALILNLPKIQIEILKAIPQILIGIVQGFAKGWPLMKTAGSKLLNNVFKGAKSVDKKILTWFKGLNKRIASAIGNAASALVKKGADFIKGLLSGIKGAWSSITSWLGGIGSRIKGAVGGLGDLLTGAGKSLMQGLLNGITAGWKWIQDKVGGMGKWIKDHKGPKEYDLKLLVPNGGWIMQGLMDGIDAALPRLQNRLNGVAKTIQGTQFNASASLTYAGGMNSGLNQAQLNSGTTYNVYINGAQVNDDEQIQQQFKVLLTTMARKGMM